MLRHSFGFVAYTSSPLSKHRLDREQLLAALKAILVDQRFDFLAGECAPESRQGVTIFRDAQRCEIGLSFSRPGPDPYEVAARRLMVEECLAKPEETEGNAGMESHHLSVDYNFPPDPELIVRVVLRIFEEVYHVPLEDVLFSAGETGKFRTGLSWKKDEDYLAEIAT